MDNYNYPIGADTPNAPWNQEDVEPIEVKVSASCTMSRSATIETTDYTKEEWSESSYEDGELVTTSGIDYDFSDCNFITEFKSKYSTIQELLDEFKKLINEKLQYYEYSTEVNKMSAKNIQSKIKYYHNLIKEIDAWNEDEFEVVKD